MSFATLAKSLKAKKKKRKREDTQPVTSAAPAPQQAPQPERHHVLVTGFAQGTRTGTIWRHLQEAGGLLGVRFLPPEQQPSVVATFATKLGRDYACRYLDGTRLPVSSFPRSKAAAAAAAAEASEAPEKSTTLRIVPCDALGAVLPLDDQSSAEGTPSSSSSSTPTPPPLPPPLRPGDDYPPPAIVVGGVGGSGTRLVALMLQELGLHIGPRLNESSDNLFYSLLFARGDVCSDSPEDFDVLMRVMAKGNVPRATTASAVASTAAAADGTTSGAMEASGGAFGFSSGFSSGFSWPSRAMRLTGAEERAVDRLAGRSFLGHPGLFLRQTAQELRRYATEPEEEQWRQQQRQQQQSSSSSGSSSSGGRTWTTEPLRGLWGWKEPNSHAQLERLFGKFPALKYIHVVRNGLDMAYSENQNQLHRFGKYFLGDAVANATSAAAAAAADANAHGKVGPTPNLPAFFLAPATGMGGGGGGGGAANGLGPSPSAGELGAYAGMVSPAASLRYWCVTHRRVLRLGAAANRKPDLALSDAPPAVAPGGGGGCEPLSGSSSGRSASRRFLLLNYDEICQNPEAGIGKLLDFLEVTSGDDQQASGSGSGDTRRRAIVDRLRALVKPKSSNSIGRFREHGTGAFDPADVAYAGELGFPTE